LHPSHTRKHGAFRNFRGINRAGIGFLFEKEISMRVAVMATGALGGYFGGRLAEAGHDVSFIARGANLAAIRKNGLKVESPLGNIHIKSPKATGDPKEVGEVDLVLFAVKLWDVEKSGEAAKPLVGPNTRLISMLNGIDSVERLVPIFGSNAVAAAPTVISAVISAPGVILHKNPFAAFRCGFMDGRDDARLKALVDEMKAAKVNAEFSKTIEKELWEKFVFIVGMSGATASMRMPIGPIRDDPDAFALLQSIMHEVEAVGVAKGIPLKGAAESRIALVKGLPPTIKASMLEDLERGNRLETDWFQGKVAELGRALGVPTPVNRDVYAVLKLHRMGKGVA
jgi:2-dehydropantoate 2-reductase